MKSPPELWAEVSDQDALAKHLEPFGEIRITRVDPESTVAWEGDRARGTVELSASGWGTKVTLRADPLEDEAPVEEPAVEEPPPVVEEEERRGFFARLFRRRRDVVEPQPEVIAEPVVEPEAIRVARIGEDEAAAVLDGMLDTLGAAHHRPFSR